MTRPQTRGPEVHCGRSVLLIQQPSQPSYLSQQVQSLFPMTSSLWPLTVQSPLRVLQLSLQPYLDHRRQPPRQRQLRQPSAQLSVQQSRHAQCRRMSLLPLPLQVHPASSAELGAMVPTPAQPGDRPGSLPMGSRG